MAHTSTKITKPVRLTQDLQPFFGRGGGLAALTVAVTGLSTFNKHSKHKPFYYPSTGPLTEAQRLGTTVQQQNGYYYGVKYMVGDIRDLIRGTDIFDYQKVQSGHYARALDYDGYSSVALPNIIASNLSGSFQIPYTGSSSYTFRVTYDSSNTDGSDYASILGTLGTLQSAYVVFVIKVGDKYYGTCGRLQTDHQVHPLYWSGYWDTYYEVDLASVPGINQSTTPVPYTVSVGIIKSGTSFTPSSAWNEITDSTYDGDLAYALVGGTQVTVNISKQQFYIPKALYLSYSMSNRELRLNGALDRAVSMPVYVTATVIMRPQDTGVPYTFNIPGYVTMNAGQIQFNTAYVTLDGLWEGDVVDMEWEFRVYDRIPGPSIVVYTYNSGTVYGVVIE